MANLLPPFARKQLVREYWVRVLTIVLFVLAFTLGMVTIMFIPTYVHITAEVTAMESTIRDAEAEQMRTEEAQAEIQSTNRLVQLLHSSRSARLFTYYYEALEEVAGTEVAINQFTVARQEGEIDAVQIQAVARTRQSLIDFLGILQDHDEFGRVDVPIADLAQSENINFRVSIPVLANNVDS